MTAVYENGIISHCQIGSWEIVDGEFRRGKANSIQYFQRRAVMMLGAQDLQRTLRR